MVKRGVFASSLPVWVNQNKSKEVRPAVQSGIVQAEHFEPSIVGISRVGENDEQVLIRNLKESDRRGLRYGESVIGR